MLIAASRSASRRACSSAAGPRSARVHNSSDRRSSSSAKCTHRARAFSRSTSLAPPYRPPRRVLSNVCIAACWAKKLLRSGPVLHTGDAAEDDVSYLLHSSSRVQASYWAVDVIAQEPHTRSRKARRNVSRIDLFLIQITRRVSAAIGGIDVMVSRRGLSPSSRVHDRSAARVCARLRRGHDLPRGPGVFRQVSRHVVRRTCTGPTISFRGAFA